LTRRGIISFPRGLYSVELIGRLIMKKWLRTVTAGVIFNDCNGLRVA